MNRSRHHRASARAEHPPHEHTREHDEGREHPQQRERPIGAAQVAAPSTRRWRRAGRFSPK